MNKQKNKKLYLVISGKKISSAAETFLSRMTQEDSPVAVKVVGLNSGKAGRMVSALREGIRKGAKEIYILPMGTLPKRALRDDIPLAIRQVREKNRAVDFHYAGSADVSLKK